MVRVTIHQVAREAGVSAATVSLVLNGRAQALGIRATTSAAVVEASSRLGYRANDAARRLRRRHNNVLSLLVQDLANPCFVDIAVAARAAAEERGYEVNVVGAGAVDAELRALERLRGDGSDAVVVATGRHSQRPAALEILRDLVSRGLPAVVLLDRSPDPRIPAIRVDVERGAALAVRHLYDLGHRRIAHLALQGVGPIAEAQTSQGDRFRGYTSALAERGIAADPAWLVQGADTVEGGYQMMNELLDRPAPRPTAALVYNDLTAIGALRALRDRGMTVPDDMAVVGTDGIELGRYINPSLTTIDHPRKQLGRLAVEAVCALIDGRPAPPIERVLPVELIVRESSGTAGTHLST
jgi:DNA-binding LacI/PurR family transcriptional regulator